MKTSAHTRRTWFRVTALMVGLTAGAVFQGFSGPKLTERNGSIVRVTGPVRIVSEAAVQTGVAVAPKAGEGLDNVVTEPMIRASLELLKNNGADLNKPMPSRHKVIAESRETAARVAAWAARNGFETTAPQAFHEHGGVEHFQLELVRVVMPEAKEIHEEAREVYAAVTTIPGTLYQTWEGAVVR